MREPSFLRRAALAGALALSLTGLTAGVDGAQAMPAASTLAQTAGAGDLTAVQYVYRRHYRPYRRYYRNRRAGLYRCGPGALHTHLERQACGMMGPSRRFLYNR